MNNKISLPFVSQIRAIIANGGRPNLPGLTITPVQMTGKNGQLLLKRPKWDGVKK